MLVLTRKLDEQIVIGEDIKVTLLRVRGNTVRIGIEAPRDVRVVRGEIVKGGSRASDSTGVSGSTDRTNSTNRTNLTNRTNSTNRTILMDGAGSTEGAAASPDPQEQVFAHPQPPRAIRQPIMPMRTETAMRADSAMRAESAVRVGSRSRSGGARTRVFEGKVARSGERAELRPVDSGVASGVAGESPRGAESPRGVESPRGATPLGRFVPAT